MGLNQVTKKVLLISNDKKLKEDITLKLLSNDDSDDDAMPDFVFESDMSTFDGADNAAVVVYDLDLAGGDAGRAKDDILRITQGGYSGPLILIGNRERVTTALRSRRVTKSVTKTVKKPAATSQFLMVVNSVIADKSKNTLAQETVGERSKYALLALPVGGIVIATIAFLMLNGGDTSGGDSLVENQNVTQEANGAFSDDLASIDSQVANDNREIARLSELASGAFEKGDLISPANENALAYFEQILEIDIYHEAAYQGKQDTLRELRKSYPRLIEYGEFEKAESILAVFNRVEPFDGENSRMSDMLASAKTRDNSGSQADELPGDVSQASELGEQAQQSAPQETAALRQNNAELEAKSLADIDRAIKSGSLIPPGKDNAYSLLLSAVKANAISDSKLVSTKARLASALIAQAKRSIAIPDLTMAANYISYIRNLNNRHSALKSLTTSVVEQRSRIAQTKTEAAATQANVVPAPSAGTTKPVNASRITPFEIVRKADPKYPKRAFKLDIEGWVELEYKVNEQGRAIDVRVVQADPKKIFDKAGIEALNRWKFKPAIDTQTGEPVISEVSTAKFNFAIGS